MRFNFSKGGEGMKTSFGKREMNKKASTIGEGMKTSFGKREMNKKASTIGEGMKTSFGKREMNKKASTIGEGMKTSFGKREMNKKASTIGEGMIMMYRIFVVALIALIILGISSVFYAHSINVRDAEAIIMARNIAECLSGEKIDFNDIVQKDKGILNECGYDEREIERFYVSAVIKNDKKQYLLSQGDRGSAWVLEMYKNIKGTEKIKNYKPGYYLFEFPLMHKGENYGVKIEVLVNEEF
jgi:hypothetical protein